MLLQNFQQHLEKHFPEINRNTFSLLAVSGGIDSVVLTDLFAKSELHFIIVHCNFRLRELESERDEHFVKLIGEKYNKRVLVETFATKEFAERNKISVQEAARKMRYDWFNYLLTDTALTPSPKFVVTAHHANDNIETLLMNFFRGTGINGLHAIPAKHEKIRRPLLFATRDEILAYAKENKLNWVEDSSNASEKYTRNFLRLSVLPELKKVFPAVEENLLQNISRFKEAELLYQQAIEIHKKKLIEQKGNEWRIPTMKLCKTEPLNTIVLEIIKDFGFGPRHVREIKKLFKSENGSYIQSPSHRIIKNRNWLIIAPLQSGKAEHLLIEKEEKKFHFANGLLEVEKLPKEKVNIAASADVAYFDAAKISFPLLLRKWKQGDFFYPLGMAKKKKLSRFFIDQKLSKTDKENVWLLEMNKKIIWLIGYRIDDRFKITNATKTALKVSYKK